MGVAGGWVIMAAFLALNKNLVVKRRGCHEAHSPAQPPSPPIAMFRPTHSSHVRMCVHACVLSRVQLCSRMDCSPPSSSLCPWDFPGMNTGVGCHFLPQGIFPTQGSNPRLLHWQALAGGFFTAEPPGKPHIHPNYTPFLTPKASLLEG